ncbi:MAG: hypothetical protein JWN86_1533 [Planctomycetota bacterium]|nr:hypothetical protein [Planctomycetota bacterium]
MGSGRYGRRLSAAVAAGVALLLSGWLALKVSRLTAAWLHDQSEFAVPFERIVLEPAPPVEYRGGSSGFLASVRDRGKLESPMRLLDADLEQLKLAFAKHPWVSRVTRVQREFPDRITVSLVYRKPLARLDLGQKTFFAVAEDGAVLAGEDIVPALSGKLIRIEGYKGRLESRPGMFLGADETGKVDPEISAAVNLARWLAVNNRSEEPRITAISLVKGPGVILLTTHRGVLVYWGNGPGEEAADEPKAREKFDRLRGLMRFLDERDSRAKPRIRVVSVLRGSDQIMLQTTNGLWALWKHGVGDETGDEPTAQEKLDRLIQWEDANPEPASRQGVYLDFTRDGPRLQKVAN